MSSNNPSSALPPSDPYAAAALENGSNSKRKRRPAGTPDPDAEVVSLSPKTLLESDRYVCEICNQGFQRDQNLQMHRRRHKVPWKLLKRPPETTTVVRKRVFVCPEPSCLHHDPAHALGDLVGIKKHFRRKHSNHKQWICEKCSKGYAVQSDYKAHLKTCGTRGHSCDCGRVFSRVESFIEHQDACNMARLRPESHYSLQTAAACLSRTASSPSPPSTDNNNIFSHLINKNNHPNSNPNRNGNGDHPSNQNSLLYHNLELQLLTTTTTITSSSAPKAEGNHSTHLQLSIGSSSSSEYFSTGNANPVGRDQERRKEREKPPSLAAASKLMKDEAREDMRVAMAEKAYAEEARRQAKRQIELAEEEFSKAKRLRQQAQAELEKALALNDHATKQVSSTIQQITCHTCKHQFKAITTTAMPPPLPPPDQNPVLALSYMSSAVTEGGP